MPLTTNQQLFEYRIVRVLGRGAFAPSIWPTMRFRPGRLAQIDAQGYTKNATSLANGSLCT